LLAHGRWSLRHDVAGWREQENVRKMLLFSINSVFLNLENIYPDVVQCEIYNLNISSGSKIKENLLLNNYLLEANNTVHVTLKTIIELVIVIQLRQS
jgi:hypothetical protein